MATVVKGKMCLCKTSLSDWSPERVNGILFYARYQDFVNLFSAKIPEVDFEKCFAQPVYNDETNTIEWFCASTSEFPCTLQESPSPVAEQEKNRITKAIENAAKSLSDNDRKYLAPILLTLQSEKVNSITYHNEGQVVFGVWGMIMKKGKVINDVIIDNIKDHRTHHVTYEISGKGTLSFNNIVRRHGHVLSGESDIPSFTPSHGYLVKAWLPESPSGMKVDKPLHFTIVFEKDPSFLPPETGEQDGESGETDGSSDNENDGTAGIVSGGEEQPPFSPNSPLFNVHFISDERGILHGQTEYNKKAGERVLASEIPHVEAKEGYRFIGWNKQPIDYIVNENIDFTAQYEPVEKKGWGGWWWLSGCLNWLLALLLLFLIGLLLFFLLGNHDINFCGEINNDCNCEEAIEPPTPGPLPDPVRESCDEIQRQGSNNPESFVFDMGQEGGTFTFEYATGNAIADLIVIYDGATRNDKEIFRYYGITGSGGWVSKQSKTISFSGQSILVDIIPDNDPDTYWEVKANCPN